METARDDRLLSHGLATSSAGYVEQPRTEISGDPQTEQQTKKKIKKRAPPIRINLSSCKYEVLRIVQRKLGWKEVGDDEEWEIYWTDTSVAIERIIKLSRTQKINHFNGMLEICRKRSMAKNLAKMAKAFPEHYDFFPKTFNLPVDLNELMLDVRSKAGKKMTYILKPDAGCQGRGIRLAQGEAGLTKAVREMDAGGIVVQHYLNKPFLVNGYKFDLRIYVLVLSCDPLRLFIFREGLVRFCTERYTKPSASNLDVAYMHLTNYAVNKHNEAFVANNAGGDSSEDASKWSLEMFWQYLKSQGHSSEKVWEGIKDVVVKSLCCVHPVLRNNYRSVLPPDNDGFSCFEVLGYDIMLDSSLRPWLIEVNHSPSFNIDSPLDLAIKEELISDTIDLVRVDPKQISKVKKAEKKAAASRLLAPLQKRLPKEGEAEAAVEPVKTPEKKRTVDELEQSKLEVLRQREKYESKHMGGYTRIFPSPDPAKQELYEQLLRGAEDIFNRTFAGKSRSALASITESRKQKEEQEATNKITTKTGGRLKLKAQQPPRKYRVVPVAGGEAEYGGEEDLQTGPRSGAEEQGAVCGNRHDAYCRMNSPESSSNGRCADERPFRTPPAMWSADGKEKTAQGPQGDGRHLVWTAAQHYPYPPGAGSGPSLATPQLSESPRSMASSEDLNPTSCSAAAAPGASCAEGPGTSAARDGMECRSSLQAAIHAIVGMDLRGDSRSSAGTCREAAASQDWGSLAPAGAMACAAWQPDSSGVSAAAGRPYSPRGQGSSALTYSTSTPPSGTSRLTPRNPCEPVDAASTSYIASRPYSGSAGASAATAAAGKRQTGWPLQPSPRPRSAATYIYFGLPGNYDEPPLHSTLPPRLPMSLSQQQSLHRYHPGSLFQAASPPHPCSRSAPEVSYSLEGPAGPAAACPTAQQQQQRSTCTAGLPAGPTSFCRPVSAQQVGTPGMASDRLTSTFQEDPAPSSSLGQRRMTDDTLQPSTPPQQLQRTTSLPSCNAAPGSAIGLKAVVRQHSVTKGGGASPSKGRPCSTRSAGLAVVVEATSLSSLVLMGSQNRKGLTVQGIRMKAAPQRA